MSSEQGIVSRVEDTAAWVTTIRTSACESCEAHGACSVLGGGKEMEVKVDNPLGSRVGDRVVIRFETGSLLKISFLVYIFPVLGLIGGAVAGEKISAIYELGKTLPSVAGAFLGFFLAFGVLRLTGNRLTARSEYRPKVVRILEAGRGIPPEPCRESDSAV